MGDEVEALTPPLYGLDAPPGALDLPRRGFSPHLPSPLLKLTRELAAALGWQAEDGPVIHRPDRPTARWCFHSEPLVGTRGQTPFEVPSPILRPRLLGDLERVCSGLLDLGCTVNESCGLHVHVGGLKPGEVVALVSLVYAWEECIYAVCGESRRTNLECRPVTPYYVGRFADLASQSSPRLAQVCARALELPVNEVDQDLDKFEMPRKYGLNLCALKLHGTVEFRYFPATLDARLVSAYTRLAAHTAAAARSQGWRLEARRPASDVLAFLRLIRLPGKDIDVLLARAEESAAERRCLEQRQQEEAETLAAAAVEAPRQGPMTKALASLVSRKALSCVTRVALPPLVVADGDDHCGL